MPQVSIEQFNDMRVIDMNIRCLVQTLFLGSVIVLLSAGIANAEYDFPKDPELDRALADIVGEFDYSTATIDECRVPLLSFKKEISKGTFESSRDYLAHAYVHQGMLLVCVSEDSEISDRERLDIWKAAYSSWVSAQQLAPYMSLPYFLSGLYYREIGLQNKSVADYRKAESYFIKALELEPGNNKYQSVLDEVKKLIPAKQTSGFKPIPFE